MCVCILIHNCTCVDENDETGVASFTALPREEWADIRERLMKDPVNRETLDAISTAFNLLSLETESPPVEVRNNPLNVSMELSHC